MSPADQARDLLDRLPRGDVMAAACPSRPILQHLTSRWGVLVMAALATGTHRFAELRRRIGGISERMLAQTLRDLADDERIAHAVVPPHVDYRLTAPGRQAAAHLVGLVDWIERALPELTAARPADGAVSPPSAARSVRASAPGSGRAPGGRRPVSARASRRSPSGP